MDQDPVYRRVGEAIRETRGVMTQSQLADLIEGEQTTLSDYENARSRVPLHVLPQIEEACGVRAGTILRRAGLVDDDVEAVLESTSTLLPEDRAMIVRFYKHMRDIADG